MTEQTTQFSTAAIQERRINQEDRIFKLADFLHRTFASHADEDVMLTSIGADDLGCSIELQAATKAFIDAGITRIPADSVERTGMIAGALQIQ